MSASDEARRGEKRSGYCDDCAEEQVFVWSSWEGDAFFGYPPAPEYGWECAVCGLRVTVSEPPSHRILP